MGLLTWFDNGIYYPDVFIPVVFGALLWALGFIFFVVRTVLQLIAPFFFRSSNFLRDSVQRHIAVLRRYLKKQKMRYGPTYLLWCIRDARRVAGSLLHSVLVYGRTNIWEDSVSFALVLLIVIWLSRLSISYFSAPTVVVAPEQGITVEHKARDFLTGVYRPTIGLLLGKFSYRADTAAYGPVNALLFGFLLSKVGPIFGTCSIDNANCFQWLYKGLIMLSLVGYFLFIILISGAHRQLRNALFITYLAFLFGVTGTFGMERGNPDILWSSVVGIMCFAVLRSKRATSNAKGGMWSIFVGILAGTGANAKIFLLPVAAVAISMVPHRRLAVIIGVLTFIVFAYLPRTYGAKVAVVDIFRVSQAWIIDAAKDFDRPEQIGSNHSALALATWSTSCVSTRTCLTDPTNKLSISIVAAILLLFVFVLPFLANEGRAWIVRMRRSLRLSIWEILHTRYFFLYLALAVAVINLIPQSTFEYRLYYSLPVLLLLWVETEKNHRRSRMFLTLSVAALLMKGFWTGLTIVPEGKTLLDVRVWNSLVLLHFYFLIKAGIAYSLEISKGKNV